MRRSAPSIAKVGSWPARLLARLVTAPAYTTRGKVALVVEADVHIAQLRLAS